MRETGLACLLLVVVPPRFRADVEQIRVGPDTSFGSWDTVSSAIVGVRLQSNHAVTIESEQWATHTATVLAVFKNDLRESVTKGHAAWRTCYA